MIVLVLPDPQADDALLARARQGDKAAMSMIYQRYVDAIYQFCRLRLSDAQRAEDITSQVFTTMISDFARGKGPRRHLRGWLFQVARYKLYDTYEQGKQDPLPLNTIEQMTTLPDLQPENATLNALTAAVVRERIAELSPDQQDVLLLRFDQQLSLRETADILGKNVNTVKTLQLRAVRRLRQMLQREGVLD